MSEKVNVVVVGSGGCSYFLAPVPEERTTKGARALIRAWSASDGSSPQGQRTLNALRSKDLHQEVVTPSGDSALAFDAVF